MCRRTAILVCLLFGSLSLGYSYHKETAGGLEQAQKAASKPKPQPTEEILNNDSIIQLVKVGLSEDLIITKIQQSKYSFDTSTAGLIALKQGGVSNRLLQFMMDPTKPPQAAVAPPMPATSAPTVAPSAVASALGVVDVPASPKTGDVIADNVPSETGLYYLRGSTLVRMDLRTLASAKTAGRLGSIATLGIKSVKNNAYLIGPGAKMRVKETSPVFYARLSEGMSIDEFVLVSLYVKEDRRELEVGSKGGVVGSKQGLRMEVMKPTDTQELGPRLYKIASSILGKGEYFFYIVGSADSIKGIQGKGYDFGIE